MKKYRVAIAIANIPLFIVLSLYMLDKDFRDIINHKTESRGKKIISVTKTSTTGKNLNIQINGIGYTIGK